MAKNKRGGGNPERYLLVNKVKVEVDIEIYREIDRFDKRQKYRDLAYLKLKEKAFDENVYGKTEGTEDEALDHVLLCELRKALAKLSPDEQTIIDELFNKGTSERSLAEMLGVLQSTLHYRKKAILQKLRESIKF